jgi:CRISPR/Cas system CMR-associated protein Cmr3 (group 5 of RAMP superfamily)
VLFLECATVWFLLLVSEFQNIRCKTRESIVSETLTNVYQTARRKIQKINPLAYYFFTQKMVSRSIYNLKIDTIYMYDITFDRSFLQLSNGIRNVMPSTDTKPELTEKASMAQPVSQPAVYADGLKCLYSSL